MVPMRQVYTLLHFSCHKMHIIRNEQSTRKPWPTSYSFLLHLHIHFIQHHPSIWTSTTSSNIRHILCFLMCQTNWDICPFDTSHDNLVKHEPFLWNTWSVMQNRKSLGTKWTNGQWSRYIKQFLLTELWSAQCFLLLPFLVMETIPR